MINNSVLLQHREDWIGALAIGLLVSCLLVASLIILMAIYFGGVVFVNTSKSVRFMTAPHRKIMQNYVRICFCKKDETLEQAKVRLANLAKYVKN